MASFHRNSLADEGDPYGAPQPELARREAATYACDAHLERILGVFQRFEAEHGLLPGEGAVLLLDTGVRL